MLSKASLAAADRIIQRELVSGNFQKLAQAIVQGEFGDTTAWTLTGIPFAGSLAVNLIDDEHIAGRVQGRTVFVLTTRRTLSLRVGDMVRRLSDSQDFEVVGKRDAPSPQSLSVQVLVAEGMPPE